MEKVKAMINIYITEEKDKIAAYTAYGDAEFGVWTKKDENTDKAKVEKNFIDSIKKGVEIYKKYGKFYEDLDEKEQQKALKETNIRNIKEEYKIIWQKK